MAYLLIGVPGTECCDSNHTFLLRSIPSWLIWLKYLSWFLYGNEALAINQWDGISNITCNASNGTCIDTGDKVLLNLGFEKVSHTAKKFRTQYFSFHPNTVDRKSVFKLTIPGAWEHSLTSKGEVSLYDWPPVWLVTIQLLCLCLIHNTFTRLAKSEPVKQEVSRTLILPLTK